MKTIVHRDSPSAKDEIKLTEDLQAKLMKPDKGGKKIQLVDVKQQRKTDIIEINSENVSSMHSEK